MKTTTFSLMIIFLALAFNPLHLRADTGTVSAPATTLQNEESVKAHVLVSRLYAINALDRSKLSSNEKRELRKEVGGIKSQLKTLGGGVYLSVGAIIIILLLLILFL